MQRYHYKRGDPGGAEFDDISIAENIDTVDWCVDRTCTRNHLYVLTENEWARLTGRRIDWTLPPIDM